MSKKNFEQIMASVNAGNYMSFSNTMYRGNAIPLDITSVYDNYNSAVIYAATNPVAYEGQVLTITSNDDTIAYVITPKSQGKITIEDTEYDIYIKPIGTLDENAVTNIINDILDPSVFQLNGEYYTLRGFKNAPAGTVLQKKSDTEVDWVAVSALVEGDGNAQVTSNDQSVHIISKYYEDLNVTGYDISIADSLAGIMQEVNQKISGVFVYKGTVASYAELPTEDLTVGDVYNITNGSEASETAPAINAGDNVVWNGTSWDVLAGIENLNAYVTIADLEKDYYNNTEAYNNSVAVFYEELNDVIGSEFELESDEAGHRTLHIAAIPYGKVTGLDDKILALIEANKETIDTSAFIEMTSTRHGTVDSTKKEIENLIYDLTNVKKKDVNTNLENTTIEANDLVNVIGAINEEHFKLTDGYSINGEYYMGTLGLSDTLLNTINRKLEDVKIFYGPKTEDEDGNDTSYYVGNNGRIPVATNSLYGVVVGSGEANQISIDATGHMNITKLNMGLIDFVDDEENVLVLNGGKA